MHGYEYYVCYFQTIGVVKLKFLKKKSISLYLVNLKV